MSSKMPWVTPVGKPGGADSGPAHPWGGCGAPTHRAWHGRRASCTRNSEDGVLTGREHFRKARRDGAEEQRGAVRGAPSPVLSHPHSSAGT